MILIDFLSKQKHEYNDPHEIKPILFKHIKHITHQIL